MAKTSKDYIAERQQRESEYSIMRQFLLNVVTASHASYSDRIAAINTIYKIDTEGIPYPKN